MFPRRLHSLLRRNLRTSVVSARILALGNNPITNIYKYSDRELTLPDSETLKEIENLKKASSNIFKPELSSDTYIYQKSPNNTEIKLGYYSIPKPEEYPEIINKSLVGKKELRELGIEGRIDVFNRVFNRLDERKTDYQKILASIMIGQGKTYWEAILDLDEFLDFLQFNVGYYTQILREQPLGGPSPTVTNELEYNPLNGFVTAITPFNFTAIGGNLASLPVLLGNSVIWKPSPYAIHSNHLIHQLFMEEGLPPNSLQFVPDNAEMFVKNIMTDSNFGGCAFTGSSKVFDSLQKFVYSNVDNYNQYPRMVGETGGKNFHLVGRTAEVKYVVEETIKSAFGYSGQKCSACSVLFLPESMREQYLMEFQEQSTKYFIPKDSTNQKTFLGAVISEDSYHKYHNLYTEIGDKLLLPVPNEYQNMFPQTGGYYCYPLIFESKSLDNPLLTEEHFLPILGVYFYDDSPYLDYGNREANSYDGYQNLLESFAKNHKYALTGSVFSNDKNMIDAVTEITHEMAGNFYINRKSTGSVVGYQPFGGGGKSGTNDKAGWKTLLYRFMNIRTISREKL